jgi:hypothetical protein
MAYELNGTNQRLVKLNAVVTKYPLTMACWFNADRNDVAGILVSITGDGSLNNDRFFISASGNLAGDPIRAQVQQSFVETTSGYTTGNWHHAAGVFSSSTNRSAYIDAGSSATTTGFTAAPPTLNRTTIGCQFISGGGGTNGLTFFDGRVAEVGIWNAALTQPEIASLAKGMTCDKIRPQNLVYYAPLVRDLFDAKGGLTVTNVNGATVANHPKVYA